MESRLDNEHTELSSESADEELVKALRGGEERAWSFILQRYSSLISSAAHNYTRTCRSPEAYETHEDTASGLYLLMIERVRDSIVNYYRGECALKTWIYRLIGDRRQIIKAFLMQTERGRHRADTRLPRVIQTRPALDQEVYRRLVWGKDATRISSDLGLTPIEAHELSSDIMHLLQGESPRVYRRIMANRRALQPSISLDRPLQSDDGDEIRFEAPDTGPLPDAVTEQRRLLERLPAVNELIRDGLVETSEEDIRLLMLVYDHGWSLADVVEQAELMALENVTARHQVDYRITRVLRLLASSLCDRIGEDSDTSFAKYREEVVTALKVLFREQGVAGYVPHIDVDSVPIARSSMEDADASEHGISA
jgi:hypothetical protein